MYKSFIRPLLFLLQPEAAHHLFIAFLKSGLYRVVYAKGGYFAMAGPKTVFGINFPNPVGMAAGFDKNAQVFNELADFGFGFVETGTITPKPQAGNPKPRLFRLTGDEALINRMGFNNDGAEVAAGRLEKRKANIVVGVNIGKNRDTPLEQASGDYLRCFNILFDVADYFVVNVSSPNTPGLRKLQDKEHLNKILSALSDANAGRKRTKPILVKISPDIAVSELEDIMLIVHKTGIQGIVAANTTLSRDGLVSSKQEIAAAGDGGLSGKPLASRSTELIRKIRSADKEIAIIGSGGIHSASDAREKFAAGADLIQLYTGFIYEGPGLVQGIISELYSC